MRAVFIGKFGEPGQSLEIKETDIPIIDRNEVLIKVEVFGLNYADIMARNGLYNDAPPLPFIPGYEVVGRVEDVGSDVKSFTKGDRVLAFTLFGAYAEFVKADERTMIKLPKKISSATGTALATQYCTAWYAGVMRANMQSGEKIVVHAAAGGVGTALIQLAKWKGCKVVGIAGTDEKLDYLEEQKVDVKVNYRKESFEKVVSDAYEKVDVTFDPVGGKNFRKNFKLLNHGGRHVMYGVSALSGKKGSILDKLKLAYDFGIMHPIELLMHSKAVIGVNMLHVAKSNPDIIQDCLSNVVKLAEKEVLNPQIGGHFPIQELHKAHELLGSGKSMGKIVIKW